MRVPVVAGRSLRLMQVGKWVTITAVDDFLEKQATNIINQEFGRDQRAQRQAAQEEAQILKEHYKKQAFAATFGQAAPGGA